MGGSEHVLPQTPTVHCNVTWKSLNVFQVCIPRCVNNQAWSIGVTKVVWAKRQESLWSWSNPIETFPQKGTSKGGQLESGVIRLCDLTLHNLGYGTAQSRHSTNVARGCLEVSVDLCHPAYLSDPCNPPMSLTQPLPISFFPLTLSNGQSWFSEMVKVKEPGSLGQPLVPRVILLCVERPIGGVKWVTTM